MNLRAVTGETRIAGVIGDPVRHSASPAIHNAAFAALGLDWVFLAFPVPAGQAASAVQAMAALGIEGMSVTMPHKAAVAAAVDTCTADAVALGAVNCVYRDGEKLVGHSTDGAGFIDSLRIDEGIDASGMRTAVVGAGGAARAVIRALAEAGAAEVAVVGRTPDRVRSAAALAGEIGHAADADSLARAELVVQATPVGMGDDPSAAFDVTNLKDGTVVADLVYHPRRTPVMAAAEERGLRTVGGLGMLVHQAARAFSLWTGIEAPIPEMWAAAETKTTQKDHGH